MPAPSAPLAPLPPKPQAASTGRPFVGPEKWDTTGWKQMVKPFRGAEHGKSWVQLISTTAIIATLAAAAVLAQRAGLWWLHAPLTLLTGMVFVRLFIIFHDCGHGSFFNDKRLNEWVGTLIGMVLLTPYHEWTRAHAIHHAHTGDYAKRGIGDIHTITVREYIAMPFMQRLAYRAYRNPLVLLGLGPIWVFVVLQRIPGILTQEKSTFKRTLNVHLTTLGFAGLAAAVWFGLGPDVLLYTLGPAVWLGAIIGIWMFYVQHQHEDTYWAARPEWDYATASLRGSSHYNLPAVLHWFTGNIGFHHIHHLAPKVPNYNLKACHESNPLFDKSPKIGVFQSFGLLGVQLYDEKEHRMVNWRHMAKVRAQEGLSAGQPQPTADAAEPAPVS